MTSKSYKIKNEIKTELHELDPISTGFHFFNTQLDLDNFQVKDEHLEDTDDIIEITDDEEDEMKSADAKMQAYRRKPVVQKPDEKAEDEKKTDIICKVCKKKFNYMLELELHQTEGNSNANKTYQCCGCKKLFATERSKLLHQERDHKRVLHPCQICNKKYTIWDNIENHRFNHIAEGKFKCIHCLAEFRFLHELAKHYKSHTQARLLELFKCMVCLKCFQSFDMLHMHKTTHDTDKEIKCVFCGKICVRRLDLKNHERMHMDSVKDFNCTICNQSFVNQSNLNRHLQVHKERTIKCTFCDKMFHRMFEMERHATLHTGEYQCKVCCKILSCMTSLKRHKCRPVKFKPFKCTVPNCKKKFGERDDWFAHLTEHDELSLSLSDEILKKMNVDLGEIKEEPIDIDDDET